MGMVAPLNFLKMLTVKAMISCKPYLMKISSGTSFDAFRKGIIQEDRILFPEEESQ